VWTILNWSAAWRIYARQGRLARYNQRVATFRATWREDLIPEPPDKAIAEAAWVQHIARALGWYPHDKCETK
jgi:hypothetical protein